MFHSIDGEIIEVLLKGGVKRSVHKNVLIQSPFFANALKPAWFMRKENKAIELQDTETEVFDAYVQWLYTHNAEPNVQPESYLWAKSYILGEMLIDLEYQNAVLSALMN